MPSDSKNSVAGHIAEIDAKVRTTIERRGVTNVRERWIIDAPLREFEIRALDDRLFRAPAVVKQLVNAEDAHALTEILDGIRALNEVYVGQFVSDVRVVIDDDPTGRDLEKRMMRWVSRYVEARTARPNPRDGGRAVAKFQRLYYELLPLLEPIAFADDTLNALVLARPLDYLAWQLFQVVVAPLVRVEFAPGQCRIVADPSLRKDEIGFVAALISLYGWGQAAGWEYLWREMLTGEPSAAAGRVEAPLAGLQPLASDIREMKPILARNFKAEKTVKEFTSRAWGAWMWATMDSVGAIALHTLERSLREGLHRFFALQQLNVDHDGFLAPAPLDWLGLAPDSDSKDAPDERARRLRWNHALVESFRG